MKQIFVNPHLRISQKISLLKNNYIPASYGYWFVHRGEETILLLYEDTQKKSLNPHKMTKFGSFDNQKYVWSKMDEPILLSKDGKELDVDIYQWGTEAFLITKRGKSPLSAFQEIKEDIE